MATALTFSSGAFMQCTVSTASRTANTIFDILTATTSSDRRVYGLSIVNADNSANPVRLFLSDGTNNYQIANPNVVANSGNASANAITDLFSSTLTEPIFGKTRDYNGVICFNLPKNWSIRMSLSRAPDLTTEFVHTFVFGEYY
jgi:hypothetical protein